MGMSTELSVYQLASSQAVTGQVTYSHTVGQAFMIKVVRPSALSWRVSLLSQLSPTTSGAFKHLPPFSDRKQCVQGLQAGTWGMTADGSEVSFGVDGNVLRYDECDGCTGLEIHPNPL